MTKLPSEKLIRMESSIQYVQEELKELKIEHKESYKVLSRTLEQLSSTIVKLATVTELNKGVAEKVNLLCAKQQTSLEDITDLSDRIKTLETKVWYAVGFVAALGFILPKLLSYIG